MNVRWSAGLLTVLLAGASGYGGPTRQSLSPYMNSVPPSKAFFCVGNGPSNSMLHPDRAPYTELAAQDGVILFSGAAPQQGVNFQLSAGALVYRNQMSTLGSPEPSPQVGTAGTLRQRPWYFYLPWSEARWHPGEDVAWQGYRASAAWLGGLPYWHYDVQPNVATDRHTPICASDAVLPVPYSPLTVGRIQGSTWDIHSAFNLQLARGLYQVSKVRGDFEWELFPYECPSEFREPWFQGRGRDPAFNVRIDAPAPYDQAYTLPDVHLAGNYFPNYNNVYTFEKLELDGGQLLLDFERSATWPRRETTYNPYSQELEGGALSGTMAVQAVQDQFQNEVYFDRVPNLRVPGFMGLVSGDKSSSLAS